MAWDVHPGRANGSWPDDFYDWDGRLVFAAGVPATGGELWISDGTAAGTRLLHDLVPGASSSRPRVVGEFGDDLIVMGAGLWRVSETQATQLTNRNVKSATIHGDRVIMAVGNQSSRAELFVSDGTPGGTGQVIASLRVGVSAFDPPALVVWRGRVLVRG